MICEFCQTKKEDVLYEDSFVFAVLSKTPITIGHMLVMPKEHFPIIEQVPDEIIKNLFMAVNSILMAVFRALKIEGTNILINNGVAAGQKNAHFMVNIIPRTRQDDFSFKWKQEETKEEKLKDIETKIREALGTKTEEKKEFQKVPNYLKDYLKRIP